jgi:adenylate cyclase
LVGIWAILGAIATSIDLGAAQSMERQAQVFFFRLNFLLSGGVAHPDDIIILEIDQGSLAQGENYRKNPSRYPELESIQAWPWQRTAYAKVIKKLMTAGARSVSLDIVLADPSIYGMEDDWRLRRVLQDHSGRIVLASDYELFGNSKAGEQEQLVLPNPIFAVNLNRYGLIVFLPDADQVVYQLPENFIEQVVRSQGLGEKISSFALATLRAAQWPQPDSVTGNIFFYGPPTTFDRVPFWEVLDPTNWKLHRKNKTFKDKIVLIGPTADYFQDSVATPFSKTMPGIELHANAIATLMQDRAIVEAIPNPQLRGLLILLSVAVVGPGLIRLNKRFAIQLLFTVSIITAVGGISYLSFTRAGVILPTAVPLVVIALSSASCLATGAVSTQLEQYRLRQTLERYVAAPIVREILTHHSKDFRSLLKGRRVQAAVLFCDVRDFTAFSLEVEPEQLIEQLNTYLNAMVEVILEAGGTVDKFIGDAIMAEFGSPISQGKENDAMNAVRAALGMRQALVKLQEYWRQEGQPILLNSIGINFGEAIAGDIGSYHRREYALLGDAVNVASRVEGLTRKVGTDILITQSLYELVKDQVDVVESGTHQLKGRGNNQVILYSLISLKGEDQTLYYQVREKLQV